MALVPWFSAVASARNSAKAVLFGFLLSLSVGLLAAPWVATAAHAFLQISWPLSLGVLLVFAATCAQPHLLLMAPLVRWTRLRIPEKPGAKDSMLFAACVAFLYAGLGATVPRLFDAGLGYALHGATVLRQAADVGGVPLLTFLVVFVNVLVWTMWTVRKDRDKRVPALWSRAAILVVVIGGAYLYGTIRLRAVRNAVADADDSTLRVAVAQGNVANETRLGWARGDERAAEQQLSAYMLLTEALIGETVLPDLVVWPEATFPGVFLQPMSTLQRGRANKFDRQVMRLARPIIFGAYDMRGKDDDRTLYNALFAIIPRYDQPGSKGTVQRYHKHRLLPFAENIPGLSQTAWFKAHLPSVGFFGQGTGAGFFEVATSDGRAVRLTPFICSESLSSSHVAEGVRRGGEILLNVGSDGWFGGWGEPQFHLAVSRLRSVETRRAQVRAANTGISALILPDGEIAARTDFGEKTLLEFDAPVVSTLDSLIVRWGSWFDWTALWLGAALFVLIQLRSTRRGKDPEAG